MVAAATLATTYLSLLLGALRSYSLARFEDLLEHDPARMDRLRALLSDEDRLIATLTASRGLAVVVGLVTLTGAMIAQALIERGAGVIQPLGWVLVGLQTSAAGTFLFVALGKLMPYAVGERRAERVLSTSLPAVTLLRRVLAPLGWLANGIVTITLRVANVSEFELHEELKDEILSAALAGENQGLIDETTMDVIENLMEFRNVEVTEVMTPRIDIDYVEDSMSVTELVQKARDTGRSRIPVTEGSNLDRIVGVVIVKDLLSVEGDPEVDLPSLFRQPFFVPETKRVADLLKELRQRRLHMAIVADEYGGTAGLVTIEDLIEELIGEIDDEHDKHAVPVRRLSSRELDVDAKVHVDQLNEDFGTKLPEDDDVETVGGFIALKLGRIPARGDVVRVNGTTLTVTAADQRRVERIHVHLEHAAPTT